MSQGTKVCLQGLGHMTRMAAMPMYGNKPSKNFFSRTNGPVTLKLGMQHWGPSLTYFIARSNLVTYAFVWEKVKIIDISEAILDYVLNLHQLAITAKGIC